MIVCQVRVHDGDVVVELVESGQNYNAVRVTNNASVSARARVWLDGSYYERTFTPGEVYSQSAPAKKLSDYIEGTMEAAYSIGPA